MPRELITSKRGPAPRFPYTPCVRIGNMVQVSGMVGLGPDGKLVAGGAGAEAERIFHNLAQVLPDYGVTLEDLLIARVFTTDLGRFPAINDAWVGFFGDRPPARSTVGVSALPLGAAVEIEFTFIV